MEPKPLGEEVVWPGSRAARSPHLQYPPHWQIKKSTSPSEFDQACGRGLVPISDNPSCSLHSTLIAPPWAAPRARAAIDSGGGSSFRSLSAPCAGRIAHLASRQPDQDGSPAAIGRFSRATDENGCADRLHNDALLRRLCKLTTTKTSFAGSAVILSGVIRFL